MNTLEVKDRAEWRAWLAANHDKEGEIWLVYYKVNTGVPGIEYGASVEEALCYGWVDSLIKKLDEKKYARKYTPRKESSAWSASNKKRIERLLEEGLMTEYGLQKVQAAKRSGLWDRPADKPTLTYQMPPEFEAALEKNQRAYETFHQLAPTYQKQYLAWIEVARRPETKAKRIEESIQLLAAGNKLGLK
jgi:uncharacterized protein YdeI (YjbR/CyaY-like superfamily)